jgi:hypothetical protein
MGIMGKWVAGSESVGRSLLEQSLVIGRLEDIQKQSYINATMQYNYAKYSHTPTPHYHVIPSPHSPNTPGLNMQNG